MEAQFTRMLRTVSAFLIIVILTVSVFGCLIEDEDFLFENTNSLKSQDIKVDQDLDNGKSKEQMSNIRIDQRVPEGLETATLALG
jgi:hypothetical protein